MKIISDIEEIKTEQEIKAELTDNYGDYEGHGYYKTRIPIPSGTVIVLYEPFLRIISSVEFEQDGYILKTGECMGLTTDQSLIAVEGDQWLWFAHEPEDITNNLPDSGEFDAEDVEDWDKIQNPNPDYVLVCP